LQWNLRPSGSILLETNEIACLGENLELAASFSMRVNVHLGDDDVIALCPDLEEVASRPSI